MTLDDLLRKTVELEASDLHITVGSPPRIRKSGKLLSVDLPPLTAQEAETLIFSQMKKSIQDELKSGHEVDYSVGIPGLSRFRVNAYYQRGVLASAYRRLPYEVPEIDTLGLPESVVNLTDHRKGLVLVTGATGSGKSTTLAAMVKQIASEVEGHIITIEDPIEYLYQHDSALINQREVGLDTDSFASGLRSALRQDPDVVVVGELRDMESMQAALTIAETGHLVLGTLHTNTASGAITRLVDAFPPNKQDVIRMNLSLTLLAVVTQQLVPNSNGGRSLACEVLIATPAVKSVIRENNIHQIDNYILSGAKDGMIRMDDALKHLFQEGQISRDDALHFAINPNQLDEHI
jgi:twitching motility protein PilT